jgi:hypothetical protein
LPRCAKRPRKKGSRKTNSELRRRFAHLGKKKDEEAELRRRASLRGAGAPR